MNIRMKVAHKHVLLLREYLGRGKYTRTVKVFICNDEGLQSVIEELSGGMSLHVYTMQEDGTYKYIETHRDRIKYTHAESSLQSYDMPTRM